MDPNDVFNASLMLTFLKKEETFFKNALKYMEQEHLRLQIEELALKAAIRQEVMNAASGIKVEIESPLPDSSNNSDSVKFISHNSFQKQNDNSVQSNITDDRYLEPLILNPRAFDEDGLIEFDD